MLSQSERYGLKQVLDLLPETDLISLAYTVTKGLLSVSQKEDAVQALLNVEKPSDVLKRQKITKKILFSYLNSVRSSISANLQKHEFINMCLEEWQSLEDCQYQSTDFEEMYVEDYSPEKSVPDHKSILSTMGIQFSEWFFSRYNELKDFGPEHFWIDCKLFVLLASPSNNQDINLIGSDSVVSFLSTLIHNNKFLFHANESTIRYEEEIHGLVRLIISGVVHQFSNCVGLFEWTFGLVRNPAYDNNWKIKCMRLRIQINYHQLPYNSIC